MAKFHIILCCSYFYSCLFYWNHMHPAQRLYSHSTHPNLNSTPTPTHHILRCMSEYRKNYYVVVGWLLLLPHFTPSPSCMYTYNRKHEKTLKMNPYITFFTFFMFLLLSSSFFHSTFLSPTFFLTIIYGTLKIKLNFHIML